MNLKLLTLSIFVSIPLSLNSAKASIILVPADKPTIQAGINLAQASDTVLIANGVFSGEGNRDLDFKGKAIVVLSENGPEFTTIDSRSNVGEFHRGFYFHNSEDSLSVVEGFTIIGGLAPFNHTPARSIGGGPGAPPFRRDETHLKDGPPGRSQSSAPIPTDH